MVETSVTATICMTQKGTQNISILQILLCLASCERQKGLFGVIVCPPSPTGSFPNCLWTSDLIPHADSSSPTFPCGWRESLFSVISEHRFPITCITHHFQNLSYHELYMSFSYSLITGVRERGLRQYWVKQNWIQPANSKQKGSHL